MSYSLALNCVKTCLGVLAVQQGNPRSTFLPAHSPPGSWLCPEAVPSPTLLPSALNASRRLGCQPLHASVQGPGVPAVPAPRLEAPGSPHMGPLTALSPS